MYVSVSDLIGEYGEDEIRQLTDRDRNGVVNEAIAEAKIETAQSEVDSYLRGRVAVPFADGEVPATVKQATLAIARYHLYRDPTDSVRTEYQSAINKLKDIAAGKAVLEAGGAQPAGNNLPRVKSEAPAITEHELNRYKEPRLYG